MTYASMTVLTRSGPGQADVELWLQMYEQMVKVREFEEQVNELYTQAKMPGPSHPYIGQEAVAVGACQALRRDDYIPSTHRALRIGRPVPGREPG